MDENIEMNDEQCERGENECRVCGELQHLNDCCDWPEEGPICWQCLHEERDDYLNLHILSILRVEGGRDETLATITPERWEELKAIVDAAVKDTREASGKGGRR